MNEWIFMMERDTEDRCKKELELASEVYSIDTDKTPTFSNETYWMPYNQTPFASFLNIFLESLA